MSLTWVHYHVEAELLEPLLGTVPKNTEVYSTYIATKRPEGLASDEAPLELTEEQLDDGLEAKGWTTFYTNASGDPILMDYQVKGFLKESANILKETLNLKALRSHLDNELFVTPRQIRLPAIAAEPLERPLRAMTAQGPRVTVVRSDQIPAGAVIEWDMKVLPKSRITKEVLEALLEYGEVKGLGQWRNGSYGRIKSTLTEA